MMGTFLRHSVFPVGITAEALWANIHLEIGDCEGGWSVSANFSRSMGRPPRTIFSR